ncbi:guanylate-binding protein 2 [Cinnamomum micranthum f. kanehirae]|uniref:Guanylate-binding protein 2 n=1 Tax=Cinnamomum micranthum f. kanehirae TaxID=337451 RepID=A0A443PFS2_9MAGN|nr:guanylate-binding protein 2 [Cinnamomum micranthum f. kanehirae]
MMNMLGFRGSASKARDSPPQSVPSSSTVNAAGPGKPLRLVYCDERGKFHMDPEAVATLQLVKGPIGVVSVCGRARQGKSYILNQLLGRSSGFQVASTHRPCTKGLWMWSAPLKRTALDGTEYHLLLLDSEGIDAYDQTGTYSTQIFSLAVLLSSMFIYNQMGGIDEAALDRLSLVTEMTKHIRVRASGGKTTASELGQFSPVFVWLLRDFYLDLAEDNRRITPRDYLELALRPMQGGGKGMAAKNEIRESIRALFPDRECFTLVRPLNNEKDLQRLDQISLDKLRPEFRSGLDAVTKFVFERTRPKQVGATIMTGPVLAGITQSFLDAINKGAVPTISSSWQSVEEAECRSAYETATEAYMSSFDRTKPPEEVGLREAHEVAVQKALAVFNSTAVGAGSARQKYEKFLQNFIRKAFEDYKRTAYMEADLRCSNAIQNMEKKLRAACHVPDAKLDHVIKVLDDLLSEYEASSHGPGKWQKLTSFLQQSLEGPILDLVKKRLDHISSERSALMLKFRSNEDKLELLKKQLEASENYKADYLRRYEEAIKDKKKITDEYTGRIGNLQSKCSSLEERRSSLAKALDSAKLDLSEWKRKYDQISLKQRAEEDHVNAEITSLKSRVGVAEARVAAAREQANSAQEEASEWKRKFEIAVNDAKTALQKAARIQEQTQKDTQQREDALRAEFSVSLAEKEEEIKEKTATIEHADHRLSSLRLELEAAESKLNSYDLECSALRHEIKELDNKLDSTKAAAQSFEQKARILEQEKTHLEQKYESDFRRFKEADERCRAAETEARRATKLSDEARAEAVFAQKGKSEIQHLAMERLAQLERNERHIESLERHKADLTEEVNRLRTSEGDALSKVAQLEAQVEERKKEIESLLKSNNEQRADTVQVLEGLLSTERTARAEANRRAEELSLQLQSTHRKLDALQQELTSVRLNETALDTKLRTASQGKRVRVDDYMGVESIQDMDADEQITRGKKRSRSTTSPLKMHTEDGGSVFKGDGEDNHSVQMEPEDYSKFTVQKLKQELTKHGFGAELLQLRNPSKKDFIALYEKHVLHR